MTDTVPDTPDVGAAVQALKPQLRAISVQGLLLLLLLGAASLVSGIYAIMHLDDDTPFKIATFVSAMGVATMFYVARRTRRAQEALVMPMVAEAVGLTYQKDADAFLRGLPPRLLPDAAVRVAEDHVSGQLGNHRIHMAEVHVATGGKNSRTLFKGVVAQFRNSVYMPTFFLAPHAQTRPGMVFKAWIPTDGLYHLRDVVGPSGVTYGVWTPWSDLAEPPELRAVVEILTSLETRLDAPMTLFTAVSDGEDMHLALSHSRDLFRLGGLFLNDSRLFSDVFGATRDLAVPLNLVRELVAAEVAAVANVKGA